MGARAQVGALRHHRSDTDGDATLTVQRDAVGDPSLIMKFQVPGRPNLHARINMDAAADFGTKTPQQPSSATVQRSRTEAKQCRLDPPPSNPSQPVAKRERWTDMGILVDQEVFSF